MFYLLPLIFSPCEPSGSFSEPYPYTLFFAGEGLLPCHLFQTGLWSWTQWMLKQSEGDERGMLLLLYPLSTSWRLDKAKLVSACGGM